MSRDRNTVTPATINKTYQVGDQLGKGAFGKVFRGLNFKTGEVVAIKEIEKHLIKDKEENEEQIQRELDFLQKLKHPNIVRFIDVHETGQYYYFIMEYVEGGSLHEAMRKFGVFPESLIVIYMIQVLRGLQYLHDQGVIHRDIKGANVLLTKEGMCKLADFGSCTYARQGPSAMVGTPFWMAPEIIEGNSASIKADIWSVGCMIIELLTGNPPYWNSGSSVALYRMVEDEHPPLPSSVSPDLEIFLRCCFVKTVSKRPTASELLENRWITSIWGSPIKTANTPTPRQPVNNSNTKNKTRQSVRMSIAKDLLPKFMNYRTVNQPRAKQARPTVADMYSSVNGTATHGDEITVKDNEKDKEKEKEKEKDKKRISPSQRKAEKNSESRNSPNKHAPQDKHSAIEDTIEEWWGSSNWDEEEKRRRRSSSTVTSSSNNKLTAKSRTSSVASDMSAKTLQKRTYEAAVTAGYKETINVLENLLRQERENNRLLSSHVLQTKEDKETMRKKVLSLKTMMNQASWRNQKLFLEEIDNLLSFIDISLATTTDLISELSISEIPKPETLPASSSNPSPTTTSSPAPISAIPESSSNITF